MCGEAPSTRKTAMEELTGAIRFLGAFNTIENHFRNRLNDDTSGFIKMAEKYAKSYHMQLDLPALRTFADLRNALVHQDYYGGKPVAEPVPAIVERIEGLRAKIIKPPTVLYVLPHRPVAYFDPHDPLSSVLEEIRDHDYSQFPIYEKKCYRGLLTTNCIARWLAHRLSTEGLVETEPVNAALEFSEPHDRAVHLSRTTTVPQAIKTLSPPADGRLPPAAVIITETGKPDESPLSVVVAGDLPVLVASMDDTT